MKFTENKIIRENASAVSGEKKKYEAPTAAVVLCGDDVIAKSTPLVPARVNGRFQF